MNAAYQQYKMVTIQTASPGKLVLLMYEGALVALDAAKKSLLEGREEAAHASILKAQDIISELLIALDSRGGKVAECLGALYEFMKSTLVEANIQKDVKKVEVVASLLQGLHSAWAEMLKRYNHAPTAETLI